MKKTLLFTRRALAILVCTIVTIAAAAASSQSARLDVSYRNAQLSTVLRDLQSRTGNYFVWFEGTVPASTQVTLEMTDATLTQILDAVLSANGLTWSMKGNVVSVGKATQSTQAVQQPGQRTPTITGRVVNAEGHPVAGASVALTNMPSMGTPTGVDGRYSLTLPVPLSGVSITVSYMGMETQIITLHADRTTYDVTLREKVTDMGSVVVTGVFNTPRESYTGAATTISREQLRAAGNSGIISSIGNIDPAFNLIQDLEYGSDPNRLPNITMRGSTSMDVGVRQLQEESGVQSSANMPLFILDGFEVSVQRVMDMDQEMVESITLLKDASAAAMYGARGANGIVVITSRRPEPGKLRVSYRGSLSVEAPDFSSYNLMNAREKLAYEVAAGLFNNTVDDSFQTLQQLYNQRLTEVERGVDTYWLKYPVRTGVGHKHSLTLDGGADNFRYSAGVNYNDVAGAMKASSRRTMGGNLFFQYEWKKVKFQNDLTLTFNKNYNSPYGSFSEYAAANPLYTPYDDDGKLKQILVSSTGTTPPQAGNPLWNSTLPYRDDGSYTNIQNNLAVEWYIRPDLSLRGRLGATKQESRTDKYLSREHTSFQTSAYEGENYKLRGSYSYGTAYTMAVEGDLTLNYNKTLGERHQLYAGLSLNAGDDKSEGYGTTAYGFSAVNMANLGMAGLYAPDTKPSSTDAHSRRLGTILNLNYTFDSRYFADFSGKIEGSSKFGDNNRTAPFWSAGLGWNLHNESWIENAAWVNSLRLRLSYGTTGSQNFDPYQALTTYRYFTQNYKYWSGAYMIALGNADLTWQKTRQTNLGLDAQLWDNRIDMNIDLYDKLTQALLTDINTPTSSGFESYKANVGEVRNRGVEASINAIILRNPNGFTWSVGGNLAHNKNKILKISNSLEFLNDELRESTGANPSFLYEEGRSMNTIYAVKSLGIDPATGNELFLTKDGVRTYTWDAADKVACGVAEPKIWGNLRTMLRWKGLSLNAVLSYTVGGDVYNQTLIDKVENISTSRAGVNNPWYNLDRRALTDRWQQAGDVATFKRITDFNATNASSRFVMRENALRLSSLSLSYEVNKAWLERNLRGLEYLTVAVYADDVFYLSTIKRERGTTYPFARNFSFTLSTRF